MMLKELWFWKIVFGACVTAAIGVTFTIKPDAAGLNYTPAVKAAILAVFAALMLFLAQIPNNLNELKGTKRLDVFFSAIGAVAAVATGWFWLKDETDGNPLSYLAAPVFLGAFLLIAWVILASVDDLKQWRNRRQDRPK